ncbi:cation transporter [Patescibacteria group bacterium]|nr:cation transporter [Patescibacteria group bacterium]
MTYGWKRAEIIGAVMNGCFLVALSLYIVLEAIPKFIKPTKPTGDWWFIGTAAAGLGVNLIGTIIFARMKFFPGYFY